MPPLFLLLLLSAVAEARWRRRREDDDCDEPRDWEDDRCDAEPHRRDEDDCSIMLIYILHVCWSGRAARSLSLS